MAYDVSTLIQAVKDEAKDSSLSTSLLTRWLQRVQDTTLGHYRFSFLEQTATDTLDINDLSYTCPTDLQVIIGLVLDDDVNTWQPCYMPYREFERKYPDPSLDPATNPDAFTMYGNVIYWSFPLDKAYDLTLKYLRKPVRFTSGSIEPDIPEEYQDILMLGTMAWVEKYRENHDIAALYLRQVEDLSEDMLQRYGTRQTMTPHKARTTRQRRQKDGWRL